ncbi:translation initiation factor eIF-2B alpha/beta/delta subunit family protein [Halopseudomonas maritima]|uniref:S-methyl-5-thioribose-1-phosphate isomerase n=1 Tax=Halopseudomonas maritima TaxID=2918528 RepID=UPI001EECBF90|nr:S-methyl-5-thioribose-1-phosphate isomerase [Halopseudomonas maritima]UJJ32092.1 S-methyl-5-thioribose-1-phosphate isomerase [Halopseudomonas maritima]
MLQIEAVADSTVLRAVSWLPEGAVRLLDQRRMPELVTQDCRDEVEVLAAIRCGVVAGAAAMGVAAAFGVVLAARQLVTPVRSWSQALEPVIAAFAALGPMAANVHWTLGIMRQTLTGLAADVDVPARLLNAAEAIAAADQEANRSMARFGLQLLRRHHSAEQKLMLLGYSGELSGGGGGTAMGVVQAAYRAGVLKEVLVSEASPSQAGSRLAAWELERAGVPHLLMADSAAARIMKCDPVSWVIVGAERIAANGDVITTQGTYALAILAMHHGLRFMVVASTAALDMSLSDGDALEPEVLHGAAGASQPLDVTPVELIDAIVTEKGVIERPDEGKIAKLMSIRRLH